MLKIFVSLFASDYDASQWYQYVGTHWKRVQKNVISRNLCNYVSKHPDKLAQKILSSSLIPYVEENVKLLAMNLPIEDKWR